MSSESRFDGAERVTRAKTPVVNMTYKSKQKNEEETHQSQLLQR